MNDVFQAAKIRIIIGKYNFRMKKNRIRQVIRIT